MGHKPRSKRGKKKRRKRRGRVTSCVSSILCCFSGTNISDASDEENSEETGHRHKIAHNQESGHYGKKEIFNETVSGERGQREESHHGDRKNVQETGNISMEVSERDAKMLREEKDLGLADCDSEDLKTNSEQDTKNTLEDNGFSSDKPNDLETVEETVFKAEIDNELYEIKRDASLVQRNDCKTIRTWKKMKINQTNTEIALLNSIMNVNKRKFTLSFPTYSKFTDAVARHCSSLGLVMLKVYLPRNLQLRSELMFYNRPSASKRQINYCADDMFLPRASAKAPNNLQGPLVSFIPENQLCQQFVEIMVIAFELFRRNQPQLQENPRIEEIGRDMVVEVESDRSSAQTDSDAAIDEETKTDSNDRDADNALVSCGKATKRPLNRKLSVSMFLRGSIRNHKMEAAVAVHCSRLGLILLQVDQLHAFQLRRILASHLRAHARKSLKFCAHDFRFPEAAVLDLAMQQIPTQDVLAHSEPGPLATPTFLESQVRTQIVKPMQRPREIQNMECNKTQPLTEEISMQHQEFPRITCTKLVFAHLKKEQLNVNLNRRVHAILRLSAFKLRDSIISAIAVHSFNLGLIVLQIPSPRTEVVVAKTPSTKRMKATHLQTSGQVEQAKSYSVQAGKCLYQSLEGTEKYLNYQEGKRMRSLIRMKQCNIGNEPHRKNNVSLKTREIKNVFYEEVEGDASFRSVPKESEDHQLSHPELNAPYGVHMTKRQLANCIEDRAVPGEVATALVLHFVSTKTKIKDYRQAAVKALVEQESRQTDDQTQNKLLTGPDGVELDDRAAVMHLDDLSKGSIKAVTDVSSDITECERESPGLNECEKKSVGSKRRRKRTKKRKHYGWHSP